MILKHLSFPVIVPPWLYFLCLKQIYQEKKLKNDILLNHIEFFLSFNLFFYLHHLANLDFGVFDPRVLDMC